MGKEVNRKIAFHTLGCKVNTYETEAMMRLFENDGCEIVGFDEPADVYVINTCSVTNIADKKSRQMIHRARKNNPDAVVIATGCYVEGMSDEKAAELGCDRIIGNAEKNTIVESAKELTARYRGSRTRAAVKIEDGCNQFCSYCIIPYKRGRVSCRPKEDIIHEVTLLAEAGHKEAVLTGIHISSYGAENLLELMEGIAAIDGIERIRLGSLEPMLIDENFLARLSKNSKVCPHFHLSLQSGCDKTLRAMNRRYTADEFRQRVALIRQYYEHPAVTTDVIAGFPGETEEDFEESLAFVDEMQFFMLHIFPYSRRSGTRADRMDGHLTMAVKQERASRLEKIDEENSLKFTEYYTDREVEVLTEEIAAADGHKWLIGHTPEYIKVMIPYETAAAALPGTIGVNCDDDAADGNILINRMVICRVGRRLEKDTVVSDGAVIFA